MALHHLWLSLVRNKPKITKDKSIFSCVIFVLKYNRAKKEFGMNKQDELLTAVELGQILKISPKTIRNAGAAFPIPSIKFRGCRRWRESDVWQYLSELEHDQPIRSRKRGRPKKKPAAYTDE